MAAAEPAVATITAPYEFRCEMRTFYYLGGVRAKVKGSGLTRMRSRFWRKRIREALRARRAGTPVAASDWNTIMSLGRHRLFKPKGPYCQSCGMPLSKDEKGGVRRRTARGQPSIAVTVTWAGSLRILRFTAEEMVERVRGKLKEMHIPGF